jgi:outer membrane receptor protein involved in Fe transport
MKLPGWNRHLRCSDGLNTVRVIARALVVVCALNTLSWAQTPQGPDIAPQALPDALAKFAEQTGLQLLYVSTIVEGKNSKGASGEGSPAQVLTRLLEGTGLRFSFLNDRTVQILPPASHAERSPHRAAPSPLPVVSAGAAVETLEEVVVSASRREEKQSDVAISMMTWTSTALKESGVKTFGDLATLSPGVEFDYYPDLGPGTLTNVAIRGVNALDGSTTGIYLNDTAMISDSGGTFGKSFPFPFDLDRVEVLRGPQGTLLGEGTEGGAIRMIQTQPSLSKMSGYAQGQVAATVNGDPSYEIGAAGGGPLKENVLGFRVGAWGRWEGGYIDRVDPFTNAVVDHNVNRVIDQSFHGALTAAMAGDFLLTPAITYQSLYSRDAATFNPALSNPEEGILHSDKLLAQPVQDEFSLATLTIAGPVRSAHLTAVTSYYHRHVSEQTDATNNKIDWGSRLGLGYPTSDADTLLSEGTHFQSTWSQEIRLASASESRVSWIVGGLYQHSKFSVLGVLYPHTTAAGVQVGNMKTTYDGTKNDLAAYGEVRIPLGAHFTANLGLRAERLIWDVALTSGALDDPNLPVTHKSGAESPTAPKLVMEYRPSSQTLLYGGVTSGYRSGGVYSRIYWWCGDVVPAKYNPDHVWNYELGAKNTLFGGRMQLDTSLFHMRWSQVQDNMRLNCATSFIGNVGGAVSDGVDLNLQALAGSHTRIGLAVGYAHSFYADTIVFHNAVRVHRGDAVGTLPLVPSPLDATASIAYDLPTSRGYTLTARAEDVYHSHNPGPFATQEQNNRNFDPAKLANPATNVLNLRFTAQRAGLDVSIGVANALNTQPTLLLRDAYPGSTYFYATTFQPRTVSLEIEQRF